MTFQTNIHIKIISVCVVFLMIHQPHPSEDVCEIQSGGK